MTRVDCLALLLGGLSNTALAQSKAAKDTISKADACKKRFEASCRLLHRCTTWAKDMGGDHCEAIDPGCEQLTGPSANLASQVTRCVAEIEALSCPAAAVGPDPSDPSAMSFEEKPAACRSLKPEDAAPVKAEAPAKKDAKAP